MRLEPESEPWFEHLAKMLCTYLDLFRLELIDLFQVFLTGLKE